MLLLYIDECLDQRLLPTLAALGCDLLTVAAAQTSQLSDESQLRYAAAHNRVLVSHNQIHFRRLHAQFAADGDSHAGIILLPQTVPLSRLVARMTLMVEWVVTFRDRRSRLFRWSDLQQMLIRGYRSPESRCSEEDVECALGWR